MKQTVSQWNNSGHLKWEQAGNVNDLTINAGGGDLKFITSNEPYKERMVIVASGKVGIGTSNPLNKLVISEGTDQHGIEFAPGNLAYMIAYDRATSAYSDLKIDAKTIVFGTDIGAERMRIDATGNVGIGTTQPGLYNANSNDLVVGLAGGVGGNRGLTVASGSTSFGTIAFANGPTGNDLARQFIRADHNDGAMLFATGAGEKMRIDANGNVGIGGTAANFGTGVPVLQLNGFSSSYPTRSGALRFLSQDGTSGKCDIYSADGGMYFYTGTSTTSTIRLGITATGNTTVSGSFNAQGIGSGLYATAVGVNAGNSGQLTYATAIGPNAGYSGQGVSATALGVAAGFEDQGDYGVGLGASAGKLNQGVASIAIGNSAGFLTQGTNSIAMGVSAAQNTQGTYGVSIGYTAGFESQGDNAVAVGKNAGKTSQSTNAVAVGNGAGVGSQGEAAVAVGTLAGQTSQGTKSVAVGFEAGKTTQGASSVALGYLAGQVRQGEHAVGLGHQAGRTDQGDHAIAIGRDVGFTTQGANGIAIGRGAGYSQQGTNSIAIGENAGAANQGDNGIIINSSGATANTTTPGHIYIVSSVASIDFNSTDKFNFSHTVKAPTFEGTVVRASHVIQDGAPVIDAKRLISTLSTLRNATKDETTLEGMRDALADAIGGLIENLEHEIAAMPAPEPEPEVSTMPAGDES
jgi:hypothetical protein